MHGGWTCWRTVLRRNTRRTSTSTGQPYDPELAGKVLVPVLGDPYGSVLERGELKVEFDVDSGTVRHHLPRASLSARSVLLRARARRPSLSASRLAMTSAVAAKAKRIVGALESLPSRNDPDPRRRAARQRRRCRAKAPARGPRRARARACARDRSGHRDVQRGKRHEFAASTSCMRSSKRSRIA